MAELGAFIQTQYNHQVSALELMTTATALSLAQTIVEGGAPDGASEAEAEPDASAAESRQSMRRVRRRSSPFANRPRDHFPNGELFPVSGADGDGDRPMPGGATKVTAGSDH